MSRRRKLFASRALFTFQTGLNSAEKKTCAYRASSCSIFGASRETPRPADFAA